MGLFTKKPKTTRELEDSIYNVDKMGMGWLVTKLADEKRVLEYTLKKYPFLERGQPPLADYQEKEWRMFLERNRVLF